MCVSSRPKWVIQYQVMSSTHIIRADWLGKWMQAEQKNRMPQSNEI
jgi:hypothetical protein